MLLSLVILSVAGGLGCAARSLARDFLVRSGMQAWQGILLINLTGSAALGAVLASPLGGTAAAACAGFLAGWTTYSAFSVDVVLLWRAGTRWAAIACWSGTIAGAPLAAWGAHALSGGRWQ